MLSKKTKYALIAMLALAEQYDSDKPVLISELASRNRIPKKFLELILLELKNKGVLMSKKGKGGGYALARPPEQITFGLLIRLLQGPLALVPCVSQTAYQKCDECLNEDRCAIRTVMREVRDATALILDGTSLRDAVQRSRAAALTFEI